MIEMRNSVILTDSQLESLIALKSRDIDYWLIYGWYDRDIVQQSNAADLLRFSPGNENLMLVNAYQLWLDQQPAAVN